MITIEMNQCKNREEILRIWTYPQIEKHLNKEIILLIF